MKNPIVYTLVGGLVLFVWQFFSFAAINLHGEAQTYTEKDQQILEFLDSIELEPGMYALGAPPMRSAPTQRCRKLISSGWRANLGRN